MKDIPCPCEQGEECKNCRRGCDNYPDWKQERDSKAVKDFLETDLFHDIMQLDREEVCQN